MGRHVSSFTRWSVRLAAVRPHTLGCDLRQPTSEHPAGCLQGGSGEARWGAPAGPAKAGEAVWDCWTTWWLGLLHCNSLAGRCGLRFCREAGLLGGRQQNLLERSLSGKSDEWSSLGASTHSSIKAETPSGVEGSRITDTWVGTHLPLDVCPVSVYIRAGYTRLPLMKNSPLRCDSSDWQFQHLTSSLKFYYEASPCW